MNSLGFDDRRSAFRVPYNTVASYENESVMGTGSVENISSDGMLMLTSDALNIGDVININFKYRHGQQKIDLQGEVARIARDGVGIKFLWP
jgi:hypothetical protein